MVKGWKGMVEDIGVIKEKVEAGGVIGGLRGDLSKIVSVRRVIV